jgi:uncharacterized protein (DUF433 family)
MDWRQHISFDPTVCHGRPCIKGTRVMVSVVLDNLADGESPGELAAACHIQEADIQAALLYASELAKDRYLPLAVGAA